MVNLHKCWVMVIIGKYYNGRTFIVSLTIYFLAIGCFMTQHFYFFFDSQVLFQLPSMISGAVTKLLGANRCVNCRREVLYSSPFNTDQSSAQCVITSREVWGVRVR